MILLCSASLHAWHWLDWLELISKAQSRRAIAVSPIFSVDCDLVSDLGTWKSAVSAKVHFWLLFIDPAGVSPPHCPRRSPCLIFLYPGAPCYNIRLSWSHRYNSISSKTAVRCVTKIENLDLLFFFHHSIFVTTRSGLCDWLPYRWEYILSLRMTPFIRSWSRTEIYAAEQRQSKRHY
jgi:hypothetical protein